MDEPQEKHIPTIQELFEQRLNRMVYEVEREIKAKSKWDKHKERKET